jgi:hypothetical protein
MSFGRDRPHFEDALLMNFRPWLVLILLAACGCQNMSTQLGLPQASSINPAGDSEYCPSGHAPPCN